MKKRVLGLGGLALLAIGVGVWWWTRVTPPVTEAEARAYLNRLVAAARAGDLDKLCRLNLSVTQCQQVLDDFDLRDAVPPSPPTVVRSRYSPKREDDEIAGMILVVEGTNACGKRYHGEVFVFRESRFHFKAVNAVYWSNSRYLEDRVTTPTGDPPPIC